MSEKIETLQKLKGAGELACDAARANKVKDSVNWGDLHCVEARWIVTDEGRSYFSILIEEASPNADTFRMFVGEYLAALGWKNVIVECEW